LVIEQGAAPSEGLLLGAVGQKAEVTNAHETVRQDVEQEAADKLLGIEGQGLFSVAVFAIAVAQSDLVLIDSEDTIIGERYAVGVAAKIVENRLRRTKRLFRVNDPVLGMRDLDSAVDGIDFSLSTSVS